LHPCYASIPGGQGRWSIAPATLPAIIL